MNIRNTLLCLLLISFTLSSLSNISLAFEHGSEKLQVETDDSLHFKITKLYGINSTIEGNYSIFLMDTNPPPWSMFAFGRLDWTYFASYPLASGFTFGTMNMTIYSNGGLSSYIDVSIGWFDDQGNANFYQNESRQSSGTGIDSITVDVNLQLQAGQRLMIGVRVIEGQMLQTFWFGDDEHDSRVQYIGTAQFIPEFSSITIMLTFMITMIFLLRLRKRFKNHSGDTLFQFTENQVSLTKQTKIEK
ncbi:MAG: hypothetical protein OEY22_04125 [Candidatus Bathyarchaeota archaeon]|nr:hypothetical protein [Candidatus Bathyarchaeota archaeon]